MHMQSETCVPILVCVLGTLCCEKLHLLCCWHSSGFNNDCAVNFLNAVDQALVFEDIVFIEWDTVGPIEFTDCSFNRGAFFPCKQSAIHYKIIWTIFIRNTSHAFMIAV